MSTRWILVVLAGSVCAFSCLLRATPPPIRTVEAAKENPLFTIAKATISIFCDRMRDEHLVDITLAKVLKGGSEADAIKFADNLSLFAEQGLLDQFMRESAPQMRTKYGSLPAKS